MPSISWNSFVLLLLLDTLLAIGASAFVGCLIAFAIDRPMRIGILVGAGLPLVGPLAWGVRAKLAGSFDNRPRPTLEVWLRWSVGVALALPGTAYIVAMGLPWAGAEGNVKGYAAVGEASPLDSVVGAIGLGIGGVILAGCAVSLIRLSAWGASALVVAVSGFWLAMTLDTLIISAAVNHLAVNLAGLAGDAGEAHVSTGSGTWTVLVASLVALGGGLVLGASVSQGSALPPVVAADASMITTGFDYGDGF
ncbi:MAG: hypothetical protein ABI903_10150 [Actinomycetota bacterium]